MNERNQQVFQYMLLRHHLLHCTTLSQAPPSAGFVGRQLALDLCGLKYFAEHPGLSIGSNDVLPVIASYPDHRSTAAHEIPNGDYTGICRQIVGHLQVDSSCG